MVILSTAPDVWWSMDETSGTRYDQAIGGHDLLVALDPQGTYGLPGVVGNALGTTLAGGFMRTSGAPDHSTSWSWCGWVKVADASLGNCTILDIYNAASENMVSVISSPSHFYVYLGFNFNRAVLTLPISDQSWHFWTVTFDSSINVLRLYWEGQLVDTSTSGSVPSGVWTGGNSKMLMGGDDQNTHASDEVARFPAVLTLADIQWLYNSGNGQAYYELVP
jgi:hypothetical protein